MSTSSLLRIRASSRQFLQLGLSSKTKLGSPTLRQTWATCKISCARVLQPGVGQ